MNKRQIVLDTETTGINKKGFHYENHRIIEIGAIEILNKKINSEFHVYLNPNRKISDNAYNITNIKDDFLLNKPNFKEISNDFIKFLGNSDLIIHNANFDIGFINYEFKLINIDIKIEKICNIIDTLSIARKIFPCKKNNLDDLCIRLNILNNKRKFHSAIEDARILYYVYLKLITKQLDIDFNEKLNYNMINKLFNDNNIINKKNKIILANNKEINRNNQFLDFLKKKY